ncbi:hypothetical protein FOC1_h10017211, partial [Fusarium oxysporum f. sp. cubense race 1]
MLVVSVYEPWAVVTVGDSREDESLADVDPNVASDVDSDDNDDKGSGNVDDDNVVDNEIAASEVIVDADKSDVDSVVDSTAVSDVVPDGASGNDDNDVDGGNLVGDEVSACEVTADVVVNDGNSSVPADVVSDVSSDDDDNDIVSRGPDDIDAEGVVYSDDAVDSEVDPIGIEVSDDVEVDTDDSTLEAKLVLGVDLVPVNDSIRSHSL